MAACESARCLCTTTTEAAPAPVLLLVLLVLDVLAAVCCHKRSMLSAEPLDPWLEAVAVAVPAAGVDVE